MWQPVLMISGYILGILGLMMLIPAGMDFVADSGLWSPFVSASITTIFVGFSLFLANHQKIDHISYKQGYLITITSWFLSIVFSGLPFILYNSVPSVTDAFFEATSGITGTGATIMTDVESLPPSVLLWRSMLNAVGGLGIVIFAVALLPFLGIGGMQMFQRENSDSNDKFMPKFSYIAKRIIAVYLILIALATGALFVCGMGWFDAVNHAMSAIGTGGFSTKNESVKFYDSALIDFVIMLFMLAGSLPMTFYILLFRRGNPNKYNQVFVFLKFVIISGCMLSASLFWQSEYSIADAFRYGFFSIIATITTTGLSVVDYTQWGVWITAVILLFSLCGGCTGSTCGSIKIFRWQTVYAFLHRYLLSATEPHRVIPLKIGNINASEKITTSVFVYLFAFMLSLISLSVLISLCGVDFATSISAVTACITNVGVGAINVIGPSGNYAFFSDNIKLILCFAMFLGRLEVITVFVVLSRSFWRN